MEAAGAHLALAGLVALAIVQIWLGFLGIDHLAGMLWAGIAVFLALAFRFMLPLTIGTYFGAVEVMAWPWYVGLGLAVPGLLFLFPAALIAIADKRIQ